MEKKKAAIDTMSIDKQVDASKVAGRDILSVFVRANVAPGLDSRKRMSDEEVAAQLITFFLAGTSTTATTISWAIYGLCQRPDFQRKLHKEVSAVATEAPSYEELNSLPCLDAIVRETLRTYSVAPGVFRTTAEDTMLPLSKPYVDKKGTKHNSVFVAKDARIYIPILEMSRNTDDWGPDAAIFNPERWLQRTVPEGALEMPSIAMPAFLAGPRGCIGFRFALIEVKTVLFTLFKAFKFEFGVPGSEIECDNHPPNIARPKLKGKPELGWQMPVIISRVEDDS